MSFQSAFPFVFTFQPQKPVIVEVSNESVSSDDGLIPIRQFDEKSGNRSVLGSAWELPDWPFQAF